MKRFLSLALVAAVAFVLGAALARDPGRARGSAPTAVYGSVEVMHPAALVGDDPKGLPLAVVRVVDADGQAHEVRPHDPDRVVWRIVLVSGGRRTYVYAQPVK